MIVDHTKWARPHASCQAVTYQDWWPSFRQLIKEVHNLVNLRPTISYTITTLVMSEMKREISSLALASQICLKSCVVCICNGVCSRCSGVWVCVAGCTKKEHMKQTEWFQHYYSNAKHPHRWGPCCTAPSVFAFSTTFYQWSWRGLRCRKLHSTWVNCLAPLDPRGAAPLAGPPNECDRPRHANIRTHRLFVLNGLESWLYPRAKCVLVARTTNTKSRIRFKSSFAETEPNMRCASNCAFC